MIILSRKTPTYGLLLLVAIIATALTPVSAQEAATSNTVDQPAVGTAGMVSSAHPLATQAGLRILDAGGNAFDAAVAVAAMLNVVEPMMSGIGGYGTILVFDATTDETWFLNPSGRIPAALDSDVYREPTPEYMENRRGAKAVSTPGNVNAWAAMWDRYGRLDWSSLFTDAITTASERLGTPSVRESCLREQGYGSTTHSPTAHSSPKAIRWTHFLGAINSRATCRCLSYGVDFGMDIQQAISAPRISFFEPDSLAVEGSISERVRDELQAMGHKIDVARALGSAHGLIIEYDRLGRPVRFFGGADPRGQGSARGR